MALMQGDNTSAPTAPAGKRHIKHRTGSVLQQREPTEVSRFSGQEILLALG